MKVTTKSTELWTDVVEIEHGDVKLRITNGDGILYINCYDKVKIEQYSRLDAVIKKDDEK